MGNKLNKIYDKALNYYQKGELSKALEECEKGISLDLKNAKILNLKGLLFYLNGDLKEALAIWNINDDYNDDEIARIYIKDAKKDEDKLILYKEAEEKIKELKIDEAIDKLNQCKESDFNSVSVNNALAICYLRKGNYLKADEFNKEALKININSKTAIEVKSQIESFFEDPKDKYKGNIKKIILAIGIISVSVVLVLGKINKNPQLDEEFLDNNTIFVEEIKDIVENVDYNSENRMEEKKDVVQFFTENEIEEAYSKSMELFDEEKYDEAIEILKAAYNSDVNTYYEKHILFLLASSYYNNSNFHEAIKYYEEYIEKFDNTYREEIYYKLALAYEDNDLAKSKEYAKMLQSQFVNSIYNNSKIKEILTK